MVVVMTAVEDVRARARRGDTSTRRPPRFTVVAARRPPFGEWLCSVSEVRVPSRARHGPPGRLRRGARTDRTPIERLRAPEPRAPIRARGLAGLYRRNLRPHWPRPVSTPKAGARDPHAAHSPTRKSHKPRGAGQAPRRGQDDLLRQGRRALQRGDPLRVPEEAARRASSTWRAAPFSDPRASRGRDPLSRPLGHAKVAGGVRRGTSSATKAGRHAQKLSASLVVPKLERPAELLRAKTCPSLLAAAGARPGRRGGSSSSTTASTDDSVSVLRARAPRASAVVPPRAGKPGLRFPPCRTGAEGGHGVDRRPPQLGRLGPSPTFVRAAPRAPSLSDPSVFGRSRRRSSLDRGGQGSRR